MKQSRLIKDNMKVNTKKIIREQFIEVQLISLKARKAKCKSEGSTDPHSVFNTEIHLLKAQIKALDLELKNVRSI